MGIILKIYNCFITGWYHFIVNPQKRCQLLKCGEKVHFDRGCSENWNNISIGDDVSIGRNNLFLCTREKIQIGNHVMFGPNVTMITGNHRTDIIGRYMTSISNSEKLPENDQPIVLVGDNWIGAGALIMPGVTIGEGAIVGAGAVVTHDVEPYSIVVGVPAKRIAWRFNNEEIMKHKKLIGEM